MPRLSTKSRFNVMARLQQEGDRAMALSRLKGTHTAARAAQARTAMIEILALCQLYEFPAMSKQDLLPEAWKLLRERYGVVMGHARVNPMTGMAADEEPPPQPEPYSDGTEHWTPEQRAEHDRLLAEQAEWIEQEAADQPEVIFDDDGDGDGSD